MGEDRIFVTANPAGGGLNAEQLDIGLRILDRGSLDMTEFWDKHIVDFRQTLLVAIRETTDALTSSTISLSWRTELEDQLESLIQYVELADRYVSRRSLSCERPLPFQPLRRRAHPSIQRSARPWCAAR